MDTIWRANKSFKVDATFMGRIQEICKKRGYAYTVDLRYANGNTKYTLETKFHAFRKLTSVKGYT